MTRPPFIRHSHLRRFTMTPEQIAQALTIGKQLGFCASTISVAVWKHRAWSSRSSAARDDDMQ